MPATADLMDEFAAVLQSCDLPFRDFGGRVRFDGPVRTVRCRDDNALVRSILAQRGQGGVLVIDGGGLRYSALVGDVIAGLACTNGWSGIIVHGVIRDSAAIGVLDIGLKALGTNPRRSAKTGSGEIDVPVAFGSVVFTPGAHVYADEDGIVVADRALTLSHA